MNSSKSPSSQCTGRLFFSSQVFLWTVAGVAMLLLSACFITKCVVTYHILQLCDEKEFQPRDDWMAPSCYNDGSGSVKNCCPLNWLYFQVSCYFFSTNTLTWTLSVKNCSDMGAHLVVINTEEEQKFLFHAKPRGKEFYIGLTDKRHENQWEWVDGTPFNQSLRSYQNILLFHEIHSW
ncbi:PREDICTED: C-type lectin domain family 4 member E isoform X2 [Condylura cristata]|uniref:C-type lectin domain family 4 member E isoform X2 n=1 Tax=Condylura cristata TaxID=143302 RepID=UPI0006435B20|nr:PREDICTED: C-type lectin domain family 4 member E isoform X2 [Condylura cristata]